MKKMMVLAVAFAFALLGATAAFAGIAGGPHDMTDNSSVAGTDVCIHCHTPHAGSATALWNRPAVNNDANFGAVDPRGSGTCLGCHDGTVDATLTNAPGRGAGTVAITYTNLGTINNLWVLAGDGLGITNDHPISVTLGNMGTTAGASADAPLYDGNGAVITGVLGQVACSSCHDPHSTAINFIRANVSCNDCHNQ